MGKFIDSIAEGAANAATGGILGIGAGIVNNALQRGQNEKLQKQQIAAQKEMADYNVQKQLELWNKTGYGAQKQQLQEAGLNPGLLYGMGGGGSGTTAAIPGNVSGSTAQKGTEIESAMGMGIQIKQLQLQREMQEAQIEAVKSQTKLNNVEADKKAGIDTKEGETRIASLTQGIENQKAQELLTRVEASWKSIQNSIADETSQDAMAQIRYEAKKTILEVSMLGIEKHIKEETAQSKINEIKAIAIGAALKNELTRAQTGATKTGQYLDETKINQITQDIMRDWDKLSIEQREISIKEKMMLWGTDANREATNQLISVITSIMHMKGK